ncbi:peptidoglycan DD-metalloendopeptidase family protein [Streptomyces sp. NPDC093269]|uniref:peptidoglycan DD-metalloendopeptidase family protein n=1 Tax=Streptomyces sp. NPDC093269 TaxID=3366038 RepID=UPI003821E38E
MADATVVGSTRVSLIPDMSQFGDRLRIELPSAIREPAKAAGDLAGDTIRNAISKKLAKPIGVKVKATLDDATAKVSLRTLTQDRTVKITAELDDKAAVASLTRLTTDRKVKITAEIDDAAAKAKLGALSGQQTVDILPKIQDAAYRTAMRQLDRLTADRVVNIRATVDTRVAANEIRNLIQRRTVRIGADVDTRVAADSLAALTRRRTMTIQARADTASADAALRYASRDRTANIRVRTIGLGALTAGLGSLGSSGSSSNNGISRLATTILRWTEIIATALPSIASLGSAIAQMGPLAATAAPAVALLGTAFATIKLGTVGIGDAIKAAFQPATTEATKAASATHAVENAQRQLANATRSVGDAERALSEAQRSARLAQADLNVARRQAARDLEDMNAQLRQGSLDQEQAALDVKQAELELAQVRSDPTATQLQIQQADLALQRARANAEEQSRQQKRLQADTAAANKAGVEGSDTVVQAKERIRQADLQVQQQERSLADAHRAVADAARSVAEAQQQAAAQTSKLDTALAKLSPNAKAFVGQLQAMAPAWRGMRLDVQDALFAGVARRLGQVGSQVLPTVRTGLTGAAGELNRMGMNALTAVSNLERAGTLKKLFDGVSTSLHNLSRVPGQLVTGFAQLSVAAQPAFDRITNGAAGVMDRLMGKLAQGLKDGSLTDAINTALDVALKFGKVLGDIGGIFSGIFKAAGAAGGDFFGVIGAALAEIRRVINMPEVQKALTAIFTALNSIAKLLAGALGQAIQAVLPVLASLAPFVTQVTQLLGPVVGQVIQALGKALMPIAQALGPVLVEAAKAIGALVLAIAPLLPPLGELIGALLPAITPIFGTLTTVFTALAPVIAAVAKMLGPILMPIIQGLSAIISQLAKQYAKAFLDILQALLPVIPQLIPAVVQLAVSIGQILTALAPLLPQLLLLSTQFITQLLPAIIPLIGPLTQLSILMTQIATWVILKLVIPALAGLIKFMQGLRKALQPGIDAVKWLTQGIADKFSWLYDFLLGHSVIPDIVHGATKWFTDMWHGTTRIFGNLKDGALKVWNQFLGGLKSNALSAWGKIQTGWDSFSDNLTSSFKGVVKNLGKIWAGISDYVKAPIRFWIETVYNKGVTKVWNATAGKIPGIPSLGTISLPKGFARGGILPGSSSWRDGDDQLVPMRRGEGVYVSEVMRDPYERQRLYAMNQAAIRGQHPSIARAQYGFSEGGIFGGIKSIGSSIADSVGGVLKRSSDVVRGGLGDLAAKAFKPVKSGITNALGKNKNTWPGMIAQAPLMMIDRAVDYIRGKDIPESTGQWIKPVNVPFGTKFGVKGSMWSSGRHTGLDFPAKTGTRVVAVDNGTVQSALSGGPYGNHVMINHGGGLASLYAHMSAIAAKVGYGIKKGARVGSVGATGNVTGPHLHLEARVNGKAVDPMPYITGNTARDTGSGVQRWRGVVQQALGQVHQSLGLVDTTLRRMNQESGGNPKAVNRWDSNWFMGHPSVGLMQVIKGTFQAYAGKYKNTGPFLYGVSTDPLANIYASMRYALARYGSLSAAYNRPGGYARGGILGSGIRVARGQARGYASGGVIKVAGKRIDTGPIAAAVGGDFLKQLAGTASAISAEMSKVTTAIKNAFKGVKTTLDNKLLTQISTTNKKLQDLSKQRDAIASSITAANALAADTTNQANSFAALTSLPNGGNTFDAGGILGGLTTRLNQIKAFGANLKLLGDRGLSKTLLQQIIAAGPDQGAAYAQALVAATPSQLKSINSTQDAITKASTQFGQDAADAMYDAGSQSGKGYLAGLKAQQTAINNAMSSLAKAIQKSIKSALKIKSPSRVFAELGQFTVAGFAQGVREATPQAALATAHMAAMVRGSAAAVASRIENNNSSATYGDRNLYYSATTREVASRQSILDALALEDSLHRPVVVGG